MAITPTPPPRLAALRALADPVRLAVVDELSRDGACACELRAQLGLSAPLLSHHLKVLRDLGLLTSRREGTRVVYTRDEAVIARYQSALTKEITT